jgi:cytidylate kinase
VSSEVICISSTDGANADQVAAAVADTLGFRVVNEEIVARAAAEAGVDRQSIEDVEHRKTALAKIWDRLAPSPAAAGAGAGTGGSAGSEITAGMIGVAVSRSADPRRPSEELRGLIRSAIDEFVAMGDVVIFSHAASQSLAGRDHVLRVLVTASVETRSARLAESEGVDLKHGEALAKKGDAGRADYFKRFYGIDQELPTQYDIVVNTDKLTPQDAADAIAVLAARSDIPA